jgi:hypothetical protein
LAAFVAASLVVIGAGAASTPQRAKSKFSKHDRLVLATKRAHGVHNVSLLIATPRRGTAKVARDLRRIGGKVLYRNNRLGYMRVRVSLRKAEQASRVHGIQIQSRKGSRTSRRSLRPAPTRRASTHTCPRAIPVLRSSSTRIRATTAEA